MEAIEFYRKRLEASGDQLEKLKKKSRRLVSIRVFSFLLTLILFYLLVAVSLWLAIAVSAVLLGVFIAVIIRDQQNKKQIRYRQVLKKINEDEIAFLEGKFSQFADGKEFIDPNHDFAYDLDVFGPASLFQFINRTETGTGRQALADIFNEFLPAVKIAQRQKALQELSGIPEWMQEFRAAGRLEMSGEESTAGIRQWLSLPGQFLKRKSLQWLIRVLPVLNIAALLLSIFLLPVGYLVILLIISFLINYREMRNVNKIHGSLSGKDEELTGLSRLLHMIEQKDFQTDLLKDLKKQTEVNGKKASATLKDLSVLSKRFDYRLNDYVAIPLNLFLFWDIHHAFLVEKWKEQHRSKVEDWFRTIAEFDALVSLGHLAFNMEEWIFPEIENRFFSLEAEKMGHPLIHPEQRVYNDFSLNGKGKIALVTGSNMSGKTTFLRTVGVNLLLARMGAPVCAKKFFFSPVKILSSMRISDSLAENTSSFYAELKRLKNILDKVRRKEKAILLLDEILKGTNSRDRHIGADALLKQLVKNEAAGLLATHDLELSVLEKEMPENISNYNFDVQISGTELYFDYKLHRGICKSMNATILMKKIGIDIDAPDQ